MFWCGVERFQTVKIYHFSNDFLLWLYSSDPLFVRAPTAKDMVHKENPYAPRINTSQPSDLLYTCNNHRLLKLHQIKLHLLQTFLSLKHKALPLSLQFRWVFISSSHTWWFRRGGRRPEAGRCRAGEPNSPFLKTKAIFQPPFSF